MSQVTVTTTTPPVTVVCASASATTMTVVFASTSVGLPEVPDWDNEFSLPPLILMNSTVGFAGFTALLHQQPLLQMGP